MAGQHSTSNSISKAQAKDGGEDNWVNQFLQIDFILCRGNFQGLIKVAEIYCQVDGSCKQQVQSRFFWVLIF